MNKTHQKDIIVNTREFMRDFSRIANGKKNSTYTIVKHGKPIGTYIPQSRSIHDKKKYITLKDLEAVRFRSGNKKLSQSIDTIVYGS